MIEIIPHGNKRFLVSSSLDRHFKTWDLEFSPVPQSTNKRGMTSDGAWFMHWPCGVISFDDSLGYLITFSKCVLFAEQTTDHQTFVSGCFTPIHTYCRTESLDRSQC